MRVPFRLALALLWLASLSLLLTGLGGPPLRDWDEGIVARVSLELSQQPWPERLWPTYWGEPYLNKPPGLHWLVAAAIKAWRGLSASPPAALPPAWLLAAGLDLLLDDSVLMHHAIQAAGGDSTLRLAEGVHHGFLNLADGLALARTALREAGGWARRTVADEVG